MPQMMPMLWLYLFMTMFIYFILIISITYFLFNQIIKYNNKPRMTTDWIWKWY